MGVQLLQDIYLFNDFLPNELEKLGALGVVKTYNQNDTIFEACLSGCHRHTLPVVC